MMIPRRTSHAPRPAAAGFAAALFGVALLLPARLPAQDIDCERHLDRARQAVEEVWSFLIFKVGAVDLPRTQEELRPDAARAATADACADVLERFMASLHDGHANLTSFPGRTPQSIPRGIRLQRFSDRMVRPGADRALERLHVISVDSTLEAVASIPVGSEILTIDGRPAQAVLDSVQQRVSASTTWGLAHWTDYTVLRGPAGSDVTLTLRTPTGEQREVTLQRRPAPDSRTRAPEPTYVEHEILDGGYGYLRLTSFAERNITRQFDDALNSLRNTPGLILDLRDNGGGLVLVLQELLGRFFDRHTVAARIMTRNPGQQLVNMDMQPIVARTRSWTYRQPVVLLVDAGCFSACDLFASAMDEHERALIIGPSRTGGGSASPVSGGLMNTFRGAEIRVSFFIAYRGDDSHIESSGISPHVIVQPTLDDYMAGRDPVLERAIAALRDGEADFGRR